MKIKIVTDSTADLPPHLVAQLGVEVVPAYVQFDKEVYRDRVDISEDEFYRRLVEHSVYPSTSPPTPQDFADVYLKLSQEAEAIISIHISSKLSATYNSALRGKDLANLACPIEVIDSKQVTMGTGLLVKAACAKASAGTGVTQILTELKDIVPRVHILGYMDTLKYVALGGRLGKVKALVGSILSVKPILTVKDGELEPVAQVRNNIKGIRRLYDFAAEASNIQEASVIYSTTLEEAQNLSDDISLALGGKPVTLARLGPVLGVHAGPGILFVAYLS